MSASRTIEFCALSFDIQFDFLMKLIVGLGNPGEIYINSRHNIGFSVVRALSHFFKISLKKDTGTFSLSGKSKIKNQNIILAMPLTFMNLSGIAVKFLLKKYKIDLDNVLVVCDDLDLEYGRIKIRPYGSSGGHRGLESIIKFLNSDKISRLRIGIGRPAPNMDAVSFVLSSFTKKEKAQIKNTIEKAVACCQVWALEGITKSMNIFNRTVNLK